MANTHKSVNEMSHTYLQNEKRYNYTTPKSFLEQIALYKNLVGTKHAELMQKMSRLENGLEKLKSTAQQVRRRRCMCVRVTSLSLLVFLETNVYLCDIICVFR